MTDGNLRHRPNSPCLLGCYTNYENDKSQNMIDNGQIIEKLLI